MCKNLSNQHADERKFIYRSFAQGFEKIPQYLAENFGKDAIAVV